MAPPGGAVLRTLRNALLERWENIPAITMIRQTPAEVHHRAEALLARFPGLHAEILPGKSVIGGGATPDQSLDTWLIAPRCDDVVRAERKLRESDPPIIGRIEDERLVLDLRTVLPDEEDFVGQAISVCDLPDGN